jgi:hypothetical protein
MWPKHADMCAKHADMCPKHADMCPKHADMCPKSTEYVAETHGICVRKAQNMWPKDLWLRFALRFRISGIGLLPIGLE